MIQLTTLLDRGDSRSQLLEGEQRRHLNINKDPERMKSAKRLLLTNIPVNQIQMSGRSDEVYWI